MVMREGRGEGTERGIMLRLEEAKNGTATGAAKGGGATVRRKGRARGA